MAFCIKCGKELDELASFCSYCGTAVGVDVVKKQERTAYEGKIYKCPSCGEPLKAFETTCHLCGYELRGIKGSTTVMGLVERLENAKTEQQRIIIIRGYPIPNTKEDIWEFMLLATSNFDSKYYALHKDVEDMSDAWFTKIEQCYQKAKKLFSTEKEFEEIQELYNKTCLDCEYNEKNERKRMEQEKKIISKASKKERAKPFWYIVLIVLGLIFIMIPFIVVEIIGIVLFIAGIVLLCKNKRNKKTKENNKNQ